MTTYQNPVWPGYFADPFVFRARGRYYAYGTGDSIGARCEPDGRVFPVLVSDNLAQWSYSGGALEAIQPTQDSLFWAPEVAEREGAFYLYYALDYRLRLAVSDRPEGPFTDVGRDLFPDEPFSIDGHPFQDPKDGRWYLFFAKDFFDSRVGTGIAAVPLRDDMASPADSPKTILRASSDWQIFERNRTWYERRWEAWHTVEGPFVVFHQDRYYCFYSGGNWESSNYGVGVGVAEHPLGPYIDEWSSAGPSVLKGVADRIIGPGHNSVVLGPDGQTHYLAYHAWDASRAARRFCLDRLEWTPDGPRCVPTHTPQSLHRPTAPAASQPAGADASSS